MVVRARKSSVKKLFSEEQIIGFLREAKSRLKREDSNCLGIRVNPSF